MSISEELIHEIIRRILSVASPDRIILFGSAATGQMNQDSDIDLLILEPAIDDEEDEFVKIRQALRGMGFPFDIIIMAADWFDTTKNAIGGLAYPVNKFGKIIYASK
jgi:uncharacterized protein